MHAATALPEAVGPPSLAPQRRLLPSLRAALRVRRYSLKTEKAYVHWVKRYVRFHRMRHPKDMGTNEVTAFLNHLASERQIKSATGLFDRPGITARLSDQPRHSAAQFFVLGQERVGSLHRSFSYRCRVLP